MRSVRDPKAVYYGDALFVDPTQRRSYIYGGPYSAYTICSTNICHQSIFYPKAAYKNYSYDLKYRLFSDYAYNINLFAKRFKFVYLKDIVSVFRMDGLSSKEHDIVMLRDRGRLILNGLGFFYYMYYLCKKHLRIRKYLRKL
jgi:hypothetical protein